MQTFDKCETIATLGYLEESTGEQASGQQESQSTSAERWLVPVKHTVACGFTAEEESRECHALITHVWTVWTQEQP